ncbi:Protein-N(pi)-phosphohistidine--sugar phosphotransferase [Thermoanaerobacterium thermosaccharolyticum DSM 571]|uniref:Protein-N(Pi)-phosphohistidine--sugar phosphotransferase n=1 Tax=Thermoanaerobacterium thermosaccharolyticum (strain ATCC 7956 / DSM 571 / NCIMB 9385 / NCA 3814 / NCTC 13789 / WDCM 00135 / 2032) TaxID=580327 RepID=D9TQJ8_THETC|nr:PTS sugar transporter subunit IIB [Thermoanaerobacterium thermosaccharolyticum]ADL69232.1 Protein-N(pi)-phosphohistidine--sugar phosphotransferase [Thermoanaerobacterium thermosaccharolyticum DSM 571]TCW32000.1 PTS system mannose-specific IIB component [Thermohydrogenium kirishiense]
MLNIVLTRIDDRLIHGQVMTAWVKNTKANRIIVVDDDVYKDPFMEQVLKMAAPTGVKVDVYDIKTAISVLNDSGNAEERVIVLAKFPKTVLSIIEGGVAIKSLNIGGMGAGIGRKPFYKNISASEEERGIFKRILELGTHVFVQIIPDEKEVDLRKIL